MVVPGSFFAKPYKMTTIDKEVVDIENKGNEKDMETENINALDSGGGGMGDSSDRLQRFDMVLQHLHRLKTQMSNNNGLQSPAVSSAVSEPTLSMSPKSPSKNKTQNE